LSEAFAIDNIHNQIWLVVVIDAEFMNGNDVRVLKSADRFGFQLKALHRAHIGQPIGKQYFDGALSFENCMFGFVDYTGAAFAQHFDDFVLASNKVAWFF
jgi:hypothetical protein